LQAKLNHIILLSFFLARSIWHWIKSEDQVEKIYNF
jgi:hypothetical protein